MNDARADEPPSRGITRWWRNPALARAAFGAPTFLEHDATGMAEPDLSDPAQREFGEYELLELIGRGGMGLVYRARQRGLAREVAIKLLSGGPWASPEFVARFEQEARHAAQLQHPGIVAIHELGESIDGVYYAMQLVRGESLAQRLHAGGRWTPREAAMLSRQVAEAVAYAHSLGVLHLDLKPGNVLIDEDGHPLIADFGLARRIEAASDDALVAGTPGYMAPEQARPGEPLTAATDVWALGAILHELLSGQPPHGASDDALAAVPADLRAICRQCLQPVPADRYASARELAEDLGRFLEGRAVGARPLNAVQRVVRWAMREKLLAAAVAAAMLALVAGMVATSLQKRRADANAATASERLWESRREAAMRAGMDGNGHDALPRLLANIHELESAGRSGEAALDRRRFGMLEQQGVRLIDAIAIADANPLAVELDPDGATLAVAYNDSVRWYDTATLAERGRVDLRKRNASDGAARIPMLLRFSGPGKLRVSLHWYDNIVSPNDSESWLIDLDSGKVVEPPAAFADFGDATFSADGRRALLRDHRRRVQYWQVQPWKPLSPLVDLGDASRTDVLPWLLDDRDAIYAWSGMNKLEFVRLPALDASTTMDMPGMVGLSAWNRSHDGRWIALGNFDGQLFLYDTRERKLRGLPGTRGREITWVDFSEDDAWLAACSYDGSAYAFDVATGDALASGQMHHDFVLHRVGISRSRRLLLAAGEGQVGLWRIPPPGARAAAAQRIELAPVPHALGGRYAASWSLRSGLLATAGIDGQIRLWRLPPGPTLPARAPRQIGERIEFDGKRIVDVEWNRLRLYAVDGGASTAWLELPQPPGFAELVDHGRTLVVTVGPSLRVYDAPALRLRFAPVALPNSPQRLLASPDGRRVLLSFGGHDPAIGFVDRLRQFDLRNGRALPGEATVAGPLRQLAWSDDGKRLLAVGPAEAATTLHASDDLRQVAEYTHDPFQPVAWATFGADGTETLLATRAPEPLLGNDLLLRWNTASDDVGEQRALGNTQPLSILQAKGRSFIAGVNRDLVFAGAPTPRVAERHTRSEATAALALSPDARIVAHGFHREVQLLDAVTGEAIGAPLQADLNAVDNLEQLAFSPDGRMLLGRSLHGQWLLWPVAAEMRPAPELEKMLALLDAAQDDGHRLHAPNPAQRSAMRDADPGPWRPDDARPAVSARFHADPGGPSSRSHPDRGPIPDRNADTSPLLLDLGRYYNRSPEGVQLPFYSTRPQLRPYPAGLQRIGGTDFDLRGIMDAGRGSSVDPNIPNGRCIPAPDAAIGALHLLIYPVIRKPVAEEIQIGEVLLHYRDGSEARLPIRTLREVPGYGGRDHAVPLAFGISLATQASGLQGETLAAPRLPNPHPERSVRELCLRVPDSTMPLSILAITLEPAAPRPFVGKAVIARPVSRTSL